MNEIILYKNSDSSVQIEIQFVQDTFWLTQQQIADLFGTKRPAITKHISNIFKSGELDEEVVCSILEHTTQHGAMKGKMQTIKVKHYNLDVVLSVGYRVNSLRATQFRIWANSVLKDYLIKGYAINNRISRLEDRMEKIDKKVTEIDFQIKTNELPTQGIFFDGQIFDAYQFISKIIRSAKKNILLIDNYINENTITHLAKKNKKVSVILLTINNSKQLDLDIKKANEQYGGFELKLFDKSHDRFLIIDKEVVYHLGASLKDLGKKWFSFSKMDKHSVESILNQIEE